MSSVKECSPSWKWRVLVGTCLAGMMVALDFTIVNTSLNNIPVSLQSTMEQLQWFIAGFGLTFCSFLATMGRLADMLGRRKVLYTGMIVFGIASIGAGMAQTSWQLIFFRLIQGLGGSVVFPAGMAATVNAFPKEEEGRALGVYGAIIGIGLAFGPLLGGFITSLASWRWIFYVNIPVIIISFIICITVLRESRLASAPKIDWWGMLLITLFVSSLIYAITQAPDVGWLSIQTVGLFIISVISFVLLLVVESRIKVPLLPLNLFENRGFLLGCIFYVVAISSAWVLTFFVPLYLHNVLSYDAAMTGLMMLPMTALTAVIPPLAGYIFDKRGVKFAGIYLVFIPIIFSYLIMMGFDLTTSLWLLIPGYLLFGFAWGSCNGISMPTAISDLKNT
ncbi:MAG: MFS transporter, partial [Coxiellaceae bacterium]|nr:MFS transporter [Coxiellaceae bacterium]